MELRRGKFGNFLGCVRWPNCKGGHTTTRQGVPLGIPAPETTRKARRRVVELIEGTKGLLPPKPVGVMTLQECEAFLLANEPKNFWQLLDDEP